MLACLVIALLQRIATAVNVGDFSAFYCGGKAMRMQIDPYQTASLKQCENVVLGVFHHALLKGETIPAPFPPYALAVFAVISFLPPTMACVLWIFLLVVCYAVIILTLRSMTNIPLVAIVAATVVPLVMIPLPVGQLTLPVFALLLTAANALRQDRVVIASIAVLTTMLSPTIGLPACLGLAALERRTRMSLMMGGLVLAFIDTAVMPRNSILYYLFTDLPAHAFAELRHDHQYSLSHLLQMLGFAPKLSLTLGLLDYCAMLAFGVALAVAIAKKRDRRDLALLTVPTAAMFGGSFVHLSALAVASLTALVAYREIGNSKNMPQAVRTLLLAGIVTIALPFEALHLPIDMPIFVGIGLVLAYTLLMLRLRMLVIFGAGVAVCTAVVSALLHARMTLQMQDQKLSLALQKAAKSGHSLEAIWKIYIDGHVAWQGWLSMFLQLPVICGVAFVLGSVYMMSGGISLRARFPRI